MEKEYSALNAFINSRAGDEFNDFIGKFEDDMDNLKNKYHIFFHNQTLGIGNHDFVKDCINCYLINVLNNERENKGNSDNYPDYILNYFRVKVEFEVKNSLGHFLTYMNEKEQSEKSSIDDKALLNKLTDDFYRAKSSTQQLKLDLVGKDIDL